MSIRKRRLPSGKTAWQCRDASGTRRAKFQTCALAHAYLLNVNMELARGVHVADGASITLGEAADLWIARCAAERLERTTIEQYRLILDLHVAPVLGSTKLSQLTTPAIQKLVDDVASRRSRSTTKKVLKVITFAIAAAVRNGRAAYNVAREVKLQQLHRGKRRPDMPTKQEVVRAILANVDEQWRPLVMRAALTGMRGSELRGLTWDNVDLERGGRRTVRA